MCSMDKEFKRKVIVEAVSELEYDKAVECMRVYRNMIIHPTAKYSTDTTTYPMEKIMLFQKYLISNLINFDL